MTGEARAGLIGALVLAASSAALAQLVIDHDGVDCVVTGSFPLIQARLEPRGEVAQARVYFRALGTPHWYYVEMKSDGAAAFEATLPRPLDSLKGIDYYIEGIGRGVAESRTRDHSARVIADSRGCPTGLKLASALGSAPSGLLVGAAEGAPALPPGFSNVSLVSTAGGSAVGAAGAGAAGSGGISTGVLVGLGTAAAGGVAVAVARGGDDGTGTGATDGGAPTGPTTPTPTPTPTPEVTGRWAGQFVEVASAVQCSVASDLSLDLRQTAGAVTGTFQLGIRTATPAPQDPCPVRPGDAFTGPLSGVVNRDSITLQLQITGGPSFFLNGTVSTARMEGTSPPDAQGPGGSWEVVRQ